MSARLLPKSANEFSSTKFWDGFFKKRGNNAFEWYGEYTDLMHLWSQYVRAKDRLLNVGCGNSDLGERLLQTQKCSLVANVDTSRTVVAQMQKRRRRLGIDEASLVYEVMDAAELKYPDESFNCVVDKGTLDALMSDDSCQETVDRMLAECERVLAPSGRHIVVSLCQGHVVARLVERLRGGRWLLRAHECPQLAESAFPLPVFFLVFTKLRVAMPTPIVDVVDASAAVPQRLARDPPDSLAEWIRQLQAASYSLRAAIASGQSECEFQYASGDSGLPVYSCRLLTSKRSRAPGGYAVFLTPLGVGISQEQRRHVADSQKLRRLLTVQLHPWLRYESESSIKSSLSGFVMRYAPSADDSSLGGGGGGGGNRDVPFLSTGEPVYPFALANLPAEAAAALADAAGAKKQFGLERRVGAGAGWRLATLANRSLCEIACRSGGGDGDPRASESIDRLLNALEAVCGGGVCSAGLLEAPYQLELALRRAGRWRLLSAVEDGGGECHALRLVEALCHELPDARWRPLLSDGDDAGRYNLLAYFPLAAVDANEFRETSLGLERLRRIRRAVDDKNGWLLVSTREFPVVKDSLDALVERLGGLFDAVRACRLLDDGDGVERHHWLVLCRAAGGGDTDAAFQSFASACDIQWA